MNQSTQQTITGIRIAFPYALATVAPLVMAPKFAKAYAPIADQIPWLTRTLISYGLFLGNHVWLAVLLVAAIFGAFLALAHQKRLAETLETLRMPLHLSGVFIALVVILSFNLPRALTVAQ